MKNLTSLEGVKSFVDNLNEKFYGVKTEKESELKPQDLPENLDKTFLVEQDLHELGVIASRLSLRGVDAKYIADAQINNLSYQTIARIHGEFGAYLQASRWWKSK